MLIIVLIFSLIILSFELATGFWMLTVAAEQENYLSVVGMVFGWLIIILSLILVLSIDYYVLTNSQDCAFFDKFPVCSKEKQ